MKKQLIISLTLIMCFCCLPKDSSALQINMYGKAGAYYHNGKWKVCPGFRFNRCATINVSWQEIKDFIFGSEIYPKATVEVYNDEGQEDYTINVRIVSISNNAINGASPPNYIMGDDIELEQD
jgi:hypothetical protein